MMRGTGHAAPEPAFVPGVSEHPPRDNGDVMDQRGGVEFGEMEVCAISRSVIASSSCRDITGASEITSSGVMNSSAVGGTATRIDRGSVMVQNAGARLSPVARWPSGTARRGTARHRCHRLDRTIGTERRDLGSDRATSADSLRKSMPNESVDG